MNIRDKAKIEREIDDLNKEIGALEIKCAQQRRLILNRVSIRDWDLRKMQQEKKKLQDDESLLSSARRKKDKLEDRCK